MYPDETDPWPDLEAFERLAREALVRLPADVQAACERVVFRVAEQADAETLAELGIEDPLELTGLYVGAAIASEWSLAPPLQPPEVWLYREAILDEWDEYGDISLPDLIFHVLVHEIAHHMGWDDEDIERIEAEAE